MNISYILTALEVIVKIGNSAGQDDGTDAWNCAEIAQDTIRYIKEELKKELKETVLQGGARANTSRISG